MGLGLGLRARVRMRVGVWVRGLAGAAARDRSHVAREPVARPVADLQPYVGEEWRLQPHVVAAVTLSVR